MRKPKVHFDIAGRSICGVSKAGKCAVCGVLLLHQQLISEAS